MAELNGISGGSLKFRKTPNEAALDTLINPSVRDPAFNQKAHMQWTMTNQEKAEAAGCIPSELAPGLFPNPKGLLGMRQDTVQVLDAHTKKVDRRQVDYVHGLTRDRKDPMPRAADYDTEEEVPPEMTPEGKAAQKWKDARALVDSMDLKLLIGDRIRVRGNPRQVFTNLYSGPPLNYPGGGVPCDLLAPGITTMMQWRSEDLTVHPEPIYQSPEFKQTLDAELMDELHQIAKGDGLVNYTDFIEYYKEHGGKYLEGWIRRPLGVQAGADGNYGLFHYQIDK